MTPGIHYWPHLLDMSEDQCKLKLRCMELEAYSSIVSVLRARGPLTEEKLSFMKQCSKEFHISHERHKVEIRRASNDELLNTIAEVLYGPNTGSKWFIEGRRLAPIMNTEPRQSVYIELANKMAELARNHNASLPSYSEYKDDEIEMDNALLKQEEEAMLEELEKEVKAKEAASTPVAPIISDVPATPAATEPTVVKAIESKPQAPSTTSDVQMVEITQKNMSGPPLGSSSGAVTGYQRHPPTPPHKGGKGPGSRGHVEGGGKSPGSGGKRKNKRSLSIEAYDDTSTPPKRFSNIPTPRIPATPVSQRPPRFQSNSGASSQPSPRIVVLPGGMHQQHSSLTHINTGSGPRKPLLKQSPAPAPPPIISKIHRPRMFTPMKPLFGPLVQSMGGRPSAPDSTSMGVVSSTSGGPKGANSSMSTGKGGLSSGVSTPKGGGGGSSGVSMGLSKGGVSISNSKGNVSSSGGGLGSKGGSLSGSSAGVTGVGGKGNQQNNVILVQKGGKTVTGVSTANATTLANRITIANPTNKKPVESLTKFLAANKASRPSASPLSNVQTSASTPASSASPSTPGPAKPVYLKSTPSSSQNNVILVDITQDQLSGSLSVEDLLKVSGISSTSPTTSSSGTAIKPSHTSTSMPNIIKLQNPKSLGALPANFQQIKIIKSSGSKLVFPTSVGCTMETVLSLAQSSTVSSSTPVYTSSTASSAPRMMVTHTPGVRPGLKGLTTRALLPLSRGSPATAPGPRPVSALPSPTPVSTNSSPSIVTTSGVSTGSSAGTSLLPSPVATSSSSSTSQQSSMSTTISSGSQLADWLSNYVVSDKDIETDSNSPLFEDASDKGGN